MSRLLQVVSPSAASGKTLWAVALARALRLQGAHVGVVKPVAVVTPAELRADGLSLTAAHLAAAAGAPPEPWLNPVVATLTDEWHADIAVSGVRVGTAPVLGRDVVILDDLPQAVRDGIAEAIAVSIDRAQRRSDVTIVEGAGGIADLSTLGAWDPANTDVMARVDAAVMVARFSRGGAFASVAGALDLLPSALRGQVKAVAFNDIRTRADEVTAAARELAASRSVGFLGIVPWIEHFADRPQFMPGTPEADEDHAALAEAFSSHADWELLGQLVGPQACTTPR